MNQGIYPRIQEPTYEYVPANTPRMNPRIRAHIYLKIHQKPIITTLLNNYF